MPEAMARNGSGLRARASRLARPAANLVYGRYRHEAEVQRVRKHPSQPAPPVTQASSDNLGAIAARLGVHNVSGYDTLRHLAAVYADHPDYQEEWKP